MSTIGILRRDGDGFAGRLTTLNLDAAIRLAPLDKRGNDKAPDYRVLVGDLECGAAWRPTDETTGALLNLKLDDPTWPGPVHARLMAGEAEALSLIWIRRSD
jgi:uncharacterized protein (DUF736 family)